MSECERSTYHLKTLLGLETRQLSLGFIAPSDEKIKVVENSYVDDPVACFNTMNSSNDKYPYPIRSSKLNFH
jgi:hypothetical protein